MIKVYVVLSIIVRQGRTRIEPVGIIVFCALMATVAVQLLVRLWNMLGWWTGH